MGKREQNKVKKIIKYFNDNHPVTKEVVEKSCKVKLTPVSGSGAYRRTYLVDDLPIVIKFPNYSGGSVKHSRAEIKTITKITKSKRKYLQLKRYMPELLYSNLKTGVIIMKKYKPYDYTHDHVVIAELITQLVNQLWLNLPENTSCDSADVCYNNIGADENGNPKLLDLGYFMQEGHAYQS